jgi:YVTN family beta-propeller protein
MSLDARARRAAQAARNNIDRLPPPPTIDVLVARRRRRAAAMNVLAVALIVAVGGVAWKVLPIGGHQPTATGLPRHVQAAIRVGKAPAALIIEGSSIWVANSGDGTVSRIDSATNRVIATIAVGGRPTHLAAGFGAVWVANSKGLQRIDPTRNQVVHTLPLPADAGEVVLAADGCLGVSLNDGTVRLLHPIDGRELASISMASHGVWVLTSEGDRVWAANRSALIAINALNPQAKSRFDLQWDRNRTPDLTDIALAGGQMWAAGSDGAVVRFPIDQPQRELQGQLVSEDGPFAIAAGPTGVFLASRSTQTVTRFDPSTGQAKARIHLPDVSDVAVGTDAVWTLAESRGLLYRIAPQATD